MCEMRRLDGYNRTARPTSPYLRCLSTRRNSSRVGPHSVVRDFPRFADRRECRFRALTANSSGFAPSPVPVLLVEGDNRQGLGYALAKAIGNAGISASFLMAQVVGRRYAAVFGFKNDDYAAKAATLIKKAATQSRGR